MKLIIVFVVVTLLSMSCGEGGGDGGGIKQHQKWNESECSMVFLGDSITHAGPWSDLSTDEIIVCNRGIPGDTTDHVLFRLDEVIDSGTDVVYLMIGINDGFLHGMTADYVLKGIKEITAILEDTGIEVRIQSILHTRDYFSYLNPFVTSTNRKLEEWCYGTGRIFIDLNAVLSQDGKLIKEYSKDGLHINDAGYNVWIEFFDR
jgi:lysophospholipase L1-like esterase